MKLVTTSEVAKMLSVPESTLRYWRKVGVGPAWVKLEGTIRYHVADVESYVEKCRCQPSVRAYVEETRHAL